MSRPREASRVELLLEELCVRLGFCLPVHAQEKLVSDPPSNVDAFTDAVILAEGLELALVDTRLRGQVRDCVAKYLVDQDA